MSEKNNYVQSIEENADGTINITDSNNTFFSNCYPVSSHIVCDDDSVIKQQNVKFSRQMPNYLQNIINELDSMIQTTEESSFRNGLIFARNIIRKQTLL